MTTLPTSRVRDPRDAPVLRWGILGPGWIAHRFVESLAARTGQRVMAVASRNRDRAESFAHTHSIDAAFDSYDALLAWADVDIVYVATPHTEHHACALAALAAGKHVLVEKPLGVDAAQAAEIGAAATRAGLFAGEAMWTKFLPKFDVVQQIIDIGMLGPVRTVLADHGEHFTPDHRIYDPALAGGPLLDLGTYVAGFAYSVLGVPTTVAAIGQPANEHINGQVSAVLADSRGNQAVLNTTMLTNTPTTATVCGEDGILEIAGPFFMPGPFTVSLRNGTVLTYAEDPGTQVDGLHYAAVDAARCIADGRTESAVHPVVDAVRTLAIIDEMRAQLGISV
ncbi:Gfo/Idh/MocA family protein [Rhodococcoides trifolii]|nr:Gfo/Idh/MocA family oxidoreductase [Rhodococcus trifolii]